VADRPGLLERSLRRGANGFHYAAGTRRPPIGRSPKDTVWRRDRVQLWRYRGEHVRYRPPVLIVHSLISKSYVLDLLPNNSMVRFLADEGFDVFLVDWGIPDAAEADNTLETYVDHYLPEIIAATCEASGEDEVTLVGYCYGGILALLLAARHPELPIRSLVTLATPVDYTKMGFMTGMFHDGRLDADMVIDGTGMVPAQVMDAGFQSIKPTDRVVQMANLWENLWNDQFVEGFQALGQWTRDQVPFPGAAFRQTIDMIVRDNGLMTGRVRLAGRDVDLRDVRVPYLNVLAEQDTIVPGDSAAPLLGLVGSEDKNELRLKSGHVGFVAGRQAAKVARPQIADWIRRHSEPLAGDEDA
jgi:polyhydroxyalkanoate synthase